MRWTEEQDDVLRECSFRGAAYAAREIFRRCGVVHSVRAVETRASRIHCSLAVQTVCPQDALRQQNSRLKRRYGLKSEKRRALPDLSQVEY